MPGNNRLNSAKSALLIREEKSRDRPAHATSFGIAVEGSAQQRVSTSASCWPSIIASGPPYAHLLAYTCLVTWNHPPSTPPAAPAYITWVALQASRSWILILGTPHRNPRDRIQASEHHQNSQLSLTDRRSSNGRRQRRAAGHRQQAATGADMALPCHGPSGHAPLPCRQSCP